MKSASLLSRLSACFIDFVIWGVFIIIFVTLGIKLNEYLEDNTDWYYLKWSTKVIAVPFDKYVVSGNKNQFTRITNLCTTNQFDSNIDKYTLNRLYDLAFDIGFVIQPIEIQRQMIKTLFYKEIFTDSRYKKLSISDKSKVNKVFESYVAETINKDLNIFDQSKTFPTSDTTKIVVDVPVTKEQAFVSKTSKLPVHIIKLQRYLANGKSYYVQSKDVNRFVSILSKNGLNAILSTPDTNEHEVLSIDPPFVFSVLIMVLYSLICGFIFLLSWALFESSKLQGTPGKLLLHIKVVDEKGNRISYDLAFKRGIYRLFSILILGIGYNPLFGKAHRTLHDIWSKTYVVEKS